MADCQFKLVQSKLFSTAGADFEIYADPPFQPTCTVDVAIDGQNVNQRDTAGGVHFVGVGGTGRAQFRSTEANPTAVVSFTVSCRDPGCGPTTRELRVNSVKKVAGKKKGLAENILNTIFLPLTLVLIAISLVALFIAWLLHFIPGLGGAMAGPKASLKQLADALPDYLSGLAEMLRDLAK